MVDTKQFAVKILMSAIYYASTQLAEMDDAFKQKLAGIDTVIQWKVEPNGPNNYLVIKNSKIEVKMDSIADNPNYTIVLTNTDIALNLFRGQIKVEKAIKNGKIKVIGDLNEAMKQMFIFEELTHYLTD
ncbi:MAG: SCP2 sterol-binding domain-containing protein [Promethearchaeota archaeon]